jgi:Baseplate J-like protein
LPLPLPNLDDRTWSDLVAEGRGLIPAWAPTWTNYNPSDPGITLIELFAWLTEMLVYRVNTVGDANLGEFLQLINGPDWRLEGDLGAARQSTLRSLTEIHRAVTAQDFEQIVFSVNNTVDPAKGRIARVSCVPGRNLPAEWDGASRGWEGDTSPDVSVVVLSDRSPADSPGQPPAELLRRVRRLLDRARLLCTRVHVSGPRYVTVGVRVRLAIRGNLRAEAVHESALQALRRFFDPLLGGPAGGGWPFGRDIYVSEIYQILTQIEGVHDVREVIANPAEPNRVALNRLQEVEAIDLGPGELVKAQIAPGDIVIEPTEKYANRD